MQQKWYRYRDISGGALLALLINTIIFYAGMSFGGSFLKSDLIFDVFNIIVLVLVLKNNKPALIVLTIIAVLRTYTLSFLLVGLSSYMLNPIFVYLLHGIVAYAGWKIQAELKRAALASTVPPPLPPENPVV